MVSALHDLDKVRDEAWGVTQSRLCAGQFARAGSVRFRRWRVPWRSAIYPRFRSIKQPISYCGLCRAEKSSADKVMRTPNYSSNCGLSGIYVNPVDFVYSSRKFEGITPRPSFLCIMRKVGRQACNGLPDVPIFRPSEANSLVNTCRHFDTDLLASFRPSAVMISPFLPRG